MLPLLIAYERINEKCSYVVMAAGILIYLSVLQFFPILSLPCAILQIIMKQRNT